MFPVPRSFAFVVLAALLVSSCDLLNMTEPPGPGDTSGDPEVSDTQAVAEARSALEIGYALGNFEYSVADDLDLVTKLGDEVEVSWSSTNPELVSPAGQVTRPAAGSPNSAVLLTASLSRGSASDTKEFVVSVLALGPLPNGQSLVLRGEFNGWGNPSWPLVSASGGVLHQTFTAAGPTTLFKFVLPSVGTELDYWYDYKQVIYDATKGGLPASAASPEYDGYYGFNVALTTTAGSRYDVFLDPSNLHYWIKDVTADATDAYLLLKGEMNAWQGTTLVDLGNGVYSQRFVAAASTTLFKIGNSDWSVAYGFDKVTYDTTRGGLPASALTGADDGFGGLNLSLSTTAGGLYEVFFEKASGKLWVAAVQ